MMNEHNCKFMLGNLSDYVDGELAAELCSEIEKHLETCPNCTVVVNTLRRTVELYHTQADQVGLPKDVRQRLYARLNLKDYMR